MTINFLIPSRPTHASVEEALVDIIGAGPQPMVFGFGETHPNSVLLETLKVPTPEQRFQAQVMPVLAREYGVTHFGFERLPVDLNPLFGGYFGATLDSPLPESIVKIFDGYRDEFLYNNGLFEGDKEMDEAVGHERETFQQYRGCVTAYLQELRGHCQSIGKKVHIRGWMIESFFHFMTVTGVIQPGPAIFKDMNANAIGLVDEALLWGGMIALYGGWNHPNVRGSEDASYVPSIQERLGSLEGYRDVRIVAPEYILLRDDTYVHNNETLRLSQEAPLEGVLLVQRGPQSFTLVFPRTPLFEVFKSG